MADSIQTKPIRLERGQHPSWCDPLACVIHPPGDIGPAYVLHTLVLLNQEDYVVTLRQRCLLDTAAGRQTYRDTAQVFVIHNGEQVLNAAIEHTNGLRDAINRAIALAEDERYW